jgi:diguanylate cyclase (GGDEF)-like protein
LSDNRALIRVACAFGALVAALRGVENVLAGFWSNAHLVENAVVLVVSVALAVVACGSWLERFYLTLAQPLVPSRNAVAAVAIAGAAAHGVLEMLVALPLMVVGPFFFMGLPYDVALTSVVTTAVSFLVAAAAYGLAPEIMLNLSVFLLLGVVACAVAARQLDGRLRERFLESRLTAELAQHDALTRTKNRRAFDEHLARLWKQAVKEGRNIAILLIDVDHFKRYNDRHGHQAGDRTLRKIAETLQTCVRPIDLLARYGGEEFAVIFYDVGTVEAEKTAHRMCRAVGEGVTERRRDPDPEVTISIGVAVVAPTADRKAAGAVQLADQALYRAKMRGRNCVELTDETEYSLLVTGVFERATTG